MSDPVTNTDDIHPAARPFLFLGKTSVKRNFIWVPLIGMIVATVLGMLHPQKHPAPWEMIGDTPIPGSWAIFGFLAYSFIVFMAPVLFKLLARPEDYYGEGGLPDPDYTTDPMLLSSAAEMTESGANQPRSEKTMRANDLPGNEA